MILTQDRFLLSNLASVFSYQGVEKKYIQELFGGIETTYDSMLRYLTFGKDGYWKSLLLLKAALRNGHRVVDAAAGTGVLTFRIADLVAPEGRVLGVDISKEMLRVAKLKQQAHPNIRLVDFTLAAAEKLPVDDETVDCLTSCYLLKYCDLRRTLMEAFRALKPGGKFVGYDFTTPSSSVLGKLSGAYIFRGLPSLSKIVVSKGTKRVLMDLPMIISETKWDVRIPDIALASGFRNLEVSRLTSGVVTLVYCEKPSC